MGGEARAEAGNAVTTGQRSEARGQRKPRQQKKAGGAASNPSFFPTPSDFRRWLDKNHETVKELLVGFYKVGSGKPSITWPESVDAALSYGWIDGVRKSLGEESYTIRFTPRKAQSNWSNVNIKRVAELKRAGLMRPAGLAAFEKRDSKRSGSYSFEQRPKKLTAAYERTLRGNAKAWAYFQRQAPWYQRLMAFWVLDAKKEETRLKRLQLLIETCAAERRIGPQRSAKLS